MRTGIARAYISSPDQLAADVVTTAKIADLAVTTAKIAGLAVSGLKLADLAVLTGKIAGEAVTTGKIADLTVTAGKIADGIITQSKLSAALQFSKVRGYRATSDQALAAGDFRKIQFNGESFDGQNLYDEVTNFRLTVPASNIGYYRISAAVQFRYPGIQPSYVALAIYLNGARYSQAFHLFSDIVDSVSAVISDYIYLAAGNYIEFFAYADQDIEVAQGGDVSFFNIIRIF